MNSSPVVALFGEAEKGAYNAAYYCETLNELEQQLGHPPPDSCGLFFAIQALLHKHPLLFFRVKDEGFSVRDYLYGLGLLKEQQKIAQVAAIAIPGVGDTAIIDEVTHLCHHYQSIVITSEPDLYDYLTFRLI